MSKTCNACGKENRDEAKFCSSCGSPLPQKKIPPRDRAKGEAVKKFWLRLFIIAGIIIVAAGIIINKMSFYGKMEVIKQYTEKYMDVDMAVFSTVTPAEFLLESLSWNMTVNDIKKIYQYAAESPDPDFISSMTVHQSEFKKPLPHADFMSLGIYNGRLYAIKFEFGPLEQFQAQELKVPNKDEIMYARFKGLQQVFTKLFGVPAFEKNEAKKCEVLESIRLVKAGKMDTGAPSNIYYYWDAGNTKVELVLFGAKEKLHLTVRLLYSPVWKAVGK
jgi:hypothetical protein